MSASLHGTRATSLFLFILALPPATAFVTLSQSRYGAQLDGIRALQHGNYTGHTQSALGFLWTYPERTDDNRGLGGGIAWAWDPALCPHLLDYFKEDLFFAELVRCEDLQAAMHRAFASWSANHRAISFVDVTQECQTLHGAVLPNCSLVEIWVTARDPTEGTGAEAATATPTIAANEIDFRYTNGEYAQTWNHAQGRYNPRRVIETVGGVIAFGGRRTNPEESLCWYLDSTFCSHFHQLKNYSSPSNVQTAGFAIVITIALLALLSTMIQLTLVLQPHLCRVGKTKLGDPTRCEESVDALARWTLCGTALRFVLITTPWLFYRQIFLPCFECYDFEAAATHEVGHILGLGHPDMASTSAGPPHSHSSKSVHTLCTGDTNGRAGSAASSRP